MALDNAIAGHTPVFDDTPVAVLFAVSLSLVGSQEHNGS
jgi:hypothetical protein